MQTSATNRDAQAGSVAVSLVLLVVVALLVVVIAREPDFEAREHQTHIDHQLQRYDDALQQLRTLHAQAERYTSSDVGRATLALEPEARTQATLRGNAQLLTNWIMHAHLLRLARESLEGAGHDTRALDPAPEPPRWLRALIDSSSQAPRGPE